MVQNPSASICLHDINNASRRGGGMVVPNCLHGRRNSAQLGDRKCMYCFTPLVQRTVGDLMLYWLPLILPLPLPLTNQGDYLAWLLWLVERLVASSVSWAFKTNLKYWRTTPAAPSLNFLLLIPPLPTAAYRIKRMKKIPHMGMNLIWRDGLSEAGRDTKGNNINPPSLYTFRWAKGCEIQEVEASELSGVCCIVVRLVVL